jgi:N-acetylglucosaminyl-diphospho-decaprenol L-rhamnosyltransferase
VSRVSLVYVSWNARPFLERALEASRALGVPTVVVDNASTDGTAEHVRLRHPEVSLIAADTNLGFAGGVNAGVHETTSPWVVLLNPDILLTPEALTLLLRQGEHDASIGAVGAQLVGPDGVPQPTYSLRRFPTLATWAVDLLLIDQVWPDNPVTRRYLAADLDRDVDQDAEQPAAACLLVRRAAFDALGGFDTRFHPAWFEDADFCRRLRLAGYRIRYVADARIVHEGGVAMRALTLGSFSTIWYRNLLRYAARHGGVATRVAIRPLLIVGMLLRIVISAVRGRIDDARAYARVIGVALGR